MTERYLKVERLRGWIVNVLYLKRPDPIELAFILKFLDLKLIPLSRRRLAEELDFLASPSEEREMETRLIRVFPASAREKLNETDQAKCIQSYAASKNDEDLEEMLHRLGYSGPLYARITAVGQNFQEGRRGWEGIERVY